MIGRHGQGPRPAEFTAATQALDRVLTAGRYVIPIWYSDRSRLAYRRNLRYPDRSAALRRLARVPAGYLVVSG
jgi:ABC-type oligopeptide transport system substrate-binding subunit